MANQVTNYKCPACTGPLRFDSATGKLQCDFCGSSYEVAEVEKLYAEKDAQAAGAFRQAEEQAAADGEWASASGSDWGADAEKAARLFLPELRRGAYLRRDDQRDLLPLLRQQHHRARAVQRCAQARLCAALQVG
ncbi:MAG: Trm112 family protein [Oscillospiraceae bacterium]